MSKLDSFFEQKASTYRHPLLTYLESAHFEKVEVEVSRPADLLGFKAAKIYLHVWMAGTELPPTEYAWDDDLNDALVTRGIRCTSSENEMIRFGLSLRAGFRRLELRFGDGFFNSVLVMVVKEDGFAEHPEVDDVLKDIHTNYPYMGGNGFENCREMITAVIRYRAHQLENVLQYSRAESREILAGAVAKYLDERFTVTDRRRLGW